MNARNNGRSPDDRRLEQVFASIGELDKEELLEEFEQTFGEIVPPARAAGTNWQRDRDRSGKAVHNEFAPPQHDRRRTSRKMKLRDPSSPHSQFSETA